MTTAPLCTACKHYKLVDYTGRSGEPKTAEICERERKSTEAARQQWYGVNSFPIDAPGHCGVEGTLFEARVA